MNGVIGCVVLLFVGDAANYIETIYINAILTGHIEHTNIINYILIEYRFISAERRLI